MKNDQIIIKCLGESEDDDFSRDVIVGLLRALKVIDKKDPRFKKISLTSFNIVKKIALMDLPMRGVHLVLNNYAFLATGKIMEYDEVIVNNLGKKVIESDVFPCKKFIIFDGMIKMVRVLSEKIKLIYEVNLMTNRQCFRATIKLKLQTILQI